MVSGAKSRGTRECLQFECDIQGADPESWKEEDVQVNFKLKQNLKAVPSI